MLVQASRSRSHQIDKVGSRPSIAGYRHNDNLETPPGKSHAQEDTASYDQAQRSASIIRFILSEAVEKASSCEDERQGRMIQPGSDEAMHVRLRIFASGSTLSPNVKLQLESVEAATHTADHIEALNAPTNTRPAPEHQASPEVNCASS